ncbi:DUF6894 family protein [Methylobacterium dankookense]|uniref:DUF6894 domain-containing protein n=1 Tax=Methylobacterium dankookense TaxID=560405 RepID=A0A564G1G8_9HYPH|nr:hypothetical protein [Methylobacterium dankookense]GJD58244.1 hypothetical protein IFDJLNFL_4161 [Methylobacterium dankookense]VUF14077.1 hypothetical protein MTDSW087_03787 [Methylobacterium dankookense]
MPRFFFNITDGISVPDHAGRELADWHEAQHMAIHLAGRVIADNAQRMKLGEDWTMEVTNEAGLVLFRLDFHVSGSAAILGSHGTAEDPA